MIEGLLYATSNPGKVREVSRLLGYNKMRVVTPADLGINIEVPETGITLEENARSKVKAYLPQVNGMLVLADDTGLEIDALGGAPGIRVRRWRDGVTKMTDGEIIQYCLELMTGIPMGKRGAQFKTVLALGLPNGNIEVIKGTLRGIILEQADLTVKIDGFPFESLFFVPEWNMLTGQVAKLPIGQKKGRMNHREKALEKAVPRIKQLIS